MSNKEPLIIKTPFRKRLGGLWLAFAATGCFIMWNNGPSNSGGSILLVIVVILALLALHRLFSTSVTTFIPGKVPKAKQEIKHFGIFTANAEAEFDEIDILRRDNILPYCQLYCYSSLEYLKKKLRTHEYEVYEKEQKPLPGLVVVDNTTKKECERHIKNIWRFYDLWEEEEKS